MSVPEKTKQALQEAFYLFDYDKDGRIAASELGVIIRSVGLNPTERLLKEMSNEVNTKGGSADLNSLLQLISNKYQDMTTTAAELTDSFQVFDKQGNNTVSVADIKHGLSSLGERLTEEEIDGLFREADPNAEGTCNINGQ
ncbi:hypothetical protein LSH36_1283g00015 [Paralvinella palmiformis]|uniref:EF-hand domain-containing protein n=1 Tax=Paralvinella palmiformis TaxID=53620 RepID=A0AAD9MPJ6_9ANNE|nr:hypothetical protein LSH36_1283g00015 [Paralvinella palmiformis]